MNTTMTSSDPALRRTDQVRRKIHGMLHRDVDGQSVTHPYQNGTMTAHLPKRRRNEDSDSPPLIVGVRQVRRASTERIHMDPSEEKEYEQDSDRSHRTTRPQSSPSSPIADPTPQNDMPRKRAAVRPWKTMNPKGSSDAMAIIERKYEQLGNGLTERERDSDSKDTNIESEESDSESQTSRFSAVDRLQRSFRNKGKKMSLFSNRLKEIIQNKMKRPTNENGMRRKTDDDMISSSADEADGSNSRIVIHDTITDTRDWRSKSNAPAPIIIPSPSTNVRSPSPTLTPDGPPSLPARPTSKVPYLQIQELVRKNDSPSPEINPIITIDAPDDTITTRPNITTTSEPDPTLSPKPNIVPTFTRSRTEFARNSRSTPATETQPFQSPRASVMIENKLSSDVTALRTSMQQQFTTLEQQLQEVESAQSQSTSDMPILRTRIEQIEDTIKHQKTNFESRLSRLEHQIEVLQTVQKKNFRSIYDHLNALQYPSGSLSHRSNASDQGFVYDFLSLLLTWFTIGLATLADPITSLYRYIRSYLCPTPTPRTKQSVATSYSRKLRNVDGLGYNPRPPSRVR